MGPRCEQREDFCSSSPCLNGATCLSTSEGYSCECPSGFTGHNCGEEVGACHCFMINNLQFIFRFWLAEVTLTRPPGLLTFPPGRALSMATPSPVTTPSEWQRARWSWFMIMGEYSSQCQGGVGRNDKLFWAKFSKISTLWVRSGKNNAIFPCFFRT